MHKMNMSREMGIVDVCHGHKCGGMTKDRFLIHIFSIIYHKIGYTLDERERAS